MFLISFKQSVTHSLSMPLVHCGLRITYLSWPWTRGEVHSSQISDPPQGKHRDEQAFALMFTPMGDLESPLNLIHMSLDCKTRMPPGEPTHESSAQKGILEKGLVACRLQPV